MKSAIFQPGFHLHHPGIRHLVPKPPKTRHKLPTDRGQNVPTRNTPEHEPAPAPLVASGLRSDYITTRFYRAVFCPSRNPARQRDVQKSNQFKPVAQSPFRIAILKVKDLIAGSKNLPGSPPISLISEILRVKSLLSIVYGTPEKRKWLIAEVLSVSTRYPRGEGDRMRRHFASRKISSSVFSR